MVSYNTSPVQVLHTPYGDIPSFIRENETNIDRKTVESFGEEWNKFSHFSDEEIMNAGRQYFDIVTPDMMNRHSLALDIGAGSGRWSKYIAPHVRFVEAIDPGLSVITAKGFLKDLSNVRVSQAGIGSIPFADNTFDLVFSLGVFHHLPDTEGAIREAIRKVKPGGYFLVYLYYSLDNRGPLYKTIFHLSNASRMVISSLPSSLKRLVCDLLAFTVYLPFVGLAKFVKLLAGENMSKKMPLAYYRDKSLHIIRNDALDRFGTPLEKRFSKNEVETMMKSAGLSDIRFSENEPYWHAIGRKPS